MQIDLVAEGLRFMILGMSSVFTFLSVLIVVLKIQSRLLSKLGLNSVSELNITPAQKTTPSKIDNDTIAAISVAINKFRSQK